MFQSKTRAWQDMVAVNLGKAGLENEDTYKKKKRNCYIYEVRVRNVCMTKK